MKYQTLDRKFVAKWLEILDRLGRMTSSYYEQGICQKDVFIRRTADKWATGITVAMIQKVGTGICSGSGYGHREEMMTTVKRYLSINKISFNYGHSDGLNIFITDAADKKSILNTLKIDLHDLYTLEFYHITQEEFDSIYGLFIDDRPMKYFEISCWDKETCMKGSSMVFEGRDQSEAWKKGMEEDDIVLGKVLREVSVAEALESIS